MIRISIILFLVSSLFPMDAFCNYRAGLRAIYNSAIKAPTREFPTRMTQYRQMSRALRGINPAMRQVYLEAARASEDPRNLARFMRRATVRTDRAFRNAGGELAGDFRSTSSYAQHWEGTLLDMMQSHGFQRSREVSGTLSPAMWRAELAAGHIPLEPRSMAFSGQARPGSGDFAAFGFEGHGRQIHIIQALVIAQSVDAKFGVGRTANWVRGMGSVDTLFPRNVAEFTVLNIPYFEGAFRDVNMYGFWLTFFDGFSSLDQVNLKFLKSTVTPFID